MCASDKLLGDASLGGHNLRTAGSRKSEPNEESHSSALLALFMLLQDIRKFLFGELSMSLQIKFLN